MTPPDIALADEIVASLNDEQLQAAWTMRFQAERTWWPDFDAKKELPELQVAVQPSPNPTVDALNRTEVFELWPMTIVFGKTLTEKTQQEIDNLRTVVEGVRGWLQTHGFTLDDGRQFTPYNRLDEFKTFDPELIDRTKREDGTITYTGEFLSFFTIPFQLLGGENE